MLCLTVMGIVTFYSYGLMSKVLDHCENSGRRHIRFRELAADVLGDVTSPYFFRHVCILFIILSLVGVFFLSSTLYKIF